MLKTYHQQICEQALASVFSPQALETVIRANLGQDAIRYQFVHPHFHFDSNAFEASERYITEQRQLALETIRSGNDPVPARRAFGRLTHTAQDFYAHSNYIRFWADSQLQAELPPPIQVDALDPEILHHPKLQSGKIYLWDWLSFVPGLYPLAYRKAPKDSHTHMNLDSPQSGAWFPYAFEAAVKRTLFEYGQIFLLLDTAEVKRFTDH